MGSKAGQNGPRSRKTTTTTLTVEMPNAESFSDAVFKSLVETAIEQQKNSFRNHVRNLIDQFIEGESVKIEKKITKEYRAMIAAAVEEAARKDMDRALKDALRNLQIDISF